MSDDFTFEEYRKKHGKRAILLFALTPDNRLRIFVPNDNLVLTSGWTVIALIQSEPAELLEENVKPQLIVADEKK